MQPHDIPKLCTPNNTHYAKDMLGEALIEIKVVQMTVYRASKHYKIPKIHSENESKKKVNKKVNLEKEILFFHVQMKKVFPINCLPWKILIWIVKKRNVCLLYSLSKKIRVLKFGKYYL